MDVRDVRLRKLREILFTRFGGVVADLARAIDRDANFARFILNPTKPGGRRIGERLARDLERSLGLAPGYLDDGGAGGALDARARRLPLALREDLLARLDAMEEAARRLPFAFTSPVERSKIKELHAFLDDLSDELWLRRQQAQQRRERAR